MIQSEVYEWCVVVFLKCLVVWLKSAGSPTDLGGERSIISRCSDFAPYGPLPRGRLLHLKEGVHTVQFFETNVF